MLDDGYPCPHCRGAGEIQVPTEHACGSCGTGHDLRSSSNDRRFGDDSCRVCHGHGVESDWDYRVRLSCNGRGSVRG